MTKIKNKETYEAIMKRIDVLFDSTDESTSPEDPRLLELDLLSELVEEYEKETFPIEMPSLASVIQYRMHEMKLSQKDLATILQSSSGCSITLLTLGFADISFRNSF